ncbi:GPW/gp25 family protein [Kitasatospora sp. NPDC047058]|uniref:GPW/gp25 family protein n=1 Tax=Kitasatospora sp. NPDC047058 TaxID=3155620 RepID=UPI0033F6908E
MTDRLMGWGFPFRIRTGGGVERAEDFAKVEADLRHLLASGTGERAMLRTYGAGIRHRLQEPNAAPMHALLRHDIEQSLRRYMPHVRLTVPVTVSADGAELIVTLEYTVHPRDAVRRLTVALQPAGERP